VNWEAIGAIGELVGAGGVIVTLVYLAYQIRQNTAQLEHSTRTAKAAAVNASNVTLRENRQSIFESTEMAEIFLRGNNEPSELTEVQLLRYRLVMQNVTEAMLDIYSQTSVTSFSPETWATQGVTLVHRVLGTAGGRWFWDNYADNYPAAFRSEVDGILQASSSTSIKG
jgi:hypothetical protein